MNVTAQTRAYLDHLTVERGLARNTLLAYRRDLARYRAYLDEAGVTMLAEISPAHLTGFVQSLAAEDPPLAVTSVNRILVTVRGLHRFAVAEGFAPTDPAADLELATPAKRLPKALSIADVQALLDAIDTGDPAGLRDSALLELLYGTGARISEVVALDVDDIAPALAGGETGGLRLWGKGGKQRVVPVGSFAREAVGRWLGQGRSHFCTTASPPPALFLNARGGRLSRQSAWAVIQRHAEAAGLYADVSPHTLRHSYATHLLDGGADVRVVQELLGHASVTTTQLYTLVTVDHLREVFAASHPRAK
jgi:integrase/recombinase XerD